MVNQTNVIEICTNSLESSIQAQKGGANRVELCSAIPEGGLTPSYGEISMTRELLTIDVNVIIRPRSGDFMYSDNEIETMRRDIVMCRELGVNGVVFGILTSDGEIDKEACKLLLSECRGLSTTFHRAFDVCRDPMRGLEDIIELGFDRILTSGQAATAIQGVDLLAKLIEKSNDRIKIMIGCGVNQNNIDTIAKATKASEFHFSARAKIDSKMQFRKDGVPMGAVVNVDEFSNNITSSEIVATTIAALNQ